MLNILNLKKITTISLLAISMQTLGTSYSWANDASADDAPTPTPTGSLNPSTFTDTTTVGGTVSLDRIVTINSIPDVVTTETVTEDRKLDVLFLADNTSSMGAAITNVKNNATTLLGNLSTKYGDVQFGVAKYYGDPQESTSCAGYWGYDYSNNKMLVCSNKSSSKFGAAGAYDLLDPVNGGTEEQAIEKINEWQPSSANGDWQEGNFFALHQAATNGVAVNGYGTNKNTNWRPDSEKVIVWFGDAYSTTSTINQADTIAALKAQNIKVIAIHVDSKVSGHKNGHGQYLSSVVGLDYNSQASTIARETGGAYASADPAQLSTTIENLVGSAVTETTEDTTSAGKVDLTFEAHPDPDISGINITYTCTDTLGCNNVASGQSRTFRMEVEGVTTGVYNFKTKVVGVTGAVGTDRVTVVNFAD